MSNMFTEAVGGIIFKNEKDLKLIQKFCKDNLIDFDSIDGSTLYNFSVYPKCGDSESWNPYDGHCNHCGSDLVK